MKKAFLILALLCLVPLGYWLADAVRNRGVEAPTGPQGPYVGSKECAECHRKQYDTWSRTYHHSMTAPATPENMKAPIGTSPLILKFYGYDVKLQRIQDTYYADLPFSDGSYRHLPVVFTIGSRRMQQYAIADGGGIFRIPVFYSIDRRRFLHINEAFFRRKSDGLHAFAEGYSLWNPNCIFCHNTRPSPGYDASQKTFNSSVAEMGIACEECHAPGGPHVAVNRNPLRRYIFSFFLRNDPSIIHPEHLDKLRSVQICGQCHGQRLPEPVSRIENLMAHGDPYVPGQNLFAYYKPLSNTDRLPGYDQFYLRFWQDGSPRLTAYELQGILASKCFEHSSFFTCTTCHEAHGGDPKGMITPEMRTDAACVQCHQQYATAAKVRAHTHHKDGSASCYSCHMPDVVYGVMGLHPTHLIRNPDPASTVLYNMPNACSLCHLDRSVNWAVNETNRLWNKRLPAGDASFDQPEIARGIASGDVVYRSILLVHAQRRKLPGAETFYARGLLDPFYIVNIFARDGLEDMYGTSFNTTEEWIAFLKRKNVPVPETGVEPSQADASFEFGE